MVFQRRDKQSLFRKLKDTALPKKGWKRPFIYIWMRLKRRPGTPEYIGKGFAIGIWISFTPFIGIHFAGALVLAWLLRADIIASVLASLLINAPMTFGIIMPVTYRVGKAVLGLRPKYSEKSLDSFQELFHKLWPIESWQHFWHVGWELFLPMTIGGFLLGFPAAFLSYYVVKKAVAFYQYERRFLSRRKIQKQFDSVEAEIEKNNPHAK